MSDILDRLIAELAAEQAVVAAGQQRVADLTVAIEAIKAARKDVAAPSAPDIKRRGVLKRAIVDCIREGIGEVANIHGHLAKQGLATTRASISNAIHRLQSEEVIRWGAVQKRWIIRNEEGPTAGAAEPLMNGAADLPSA